MNNGAEAVKEVVSSIKVVESIYRVDRPVFKDVTIDRPVFKDKVVEVPVGIEALITELVDTIASRVLIKLDEKLAKAIDERISTIKAPKVIEEVSVVYKEVLLDKPIYKDVEVSRPVYVDKEILNPIIKDVPVINAKIEDVTVINAVLQDRVVINPKFEDVVIQKPKFVDKEVTVISLKYVDMKGNPE